MVLAGLIFWAANEQRIESTMTILYAVAALYIGEAPIGCLNCECVALRVHLLWSKFYSFILLSQWSSAISR